jgi:transketolase
MRNAFADEVTQLAAQDPRVVLLSGDIGNRLFDRLRSQSPSQFINCGVAEANMMGVAAGMALSGLRPITYTITPFTTTRCLEQIRVDVAYHEAPVIIVGTGSGLSYASLGPTHHSLEDFAILRAIPNLRVLAPWDAPSLRHVLRQALLDPSPTYIRIGKKGEKDVAPIDQVESIGKLTRLIAGETVAIVAVGTIANEAVRAANELNSFGISPTLCLAHTVKPMPETDLERLFKSHRLIVTVEEHSLASGFGESCISLAQRLGFDGRILSLGTPDTFLSKVGSQGYARKISGIDSVAIVDGVQRLISSSP